MSIFFKPYEGKQPFIFVSYPHAYSTKVVETMKILHDKGYRIWYDEGIPAGSDWPGNIARHMQDCAAVVFFPAQKALGSENCLSEISTAVRLKKPMLILPLEDCTPDEKWSALLNEGTRLDGLKTSQEMAEGILNSKIINSRFKRKWWESVAWGKVELAASVALLAASMGVFAALAGGVWSPKAETVIIQETPKETIETTPPPVLDIGEAEKYFAVSFPDSQQEKAVRSVLKISEGEIHKWELAEIEKLYFCGNMVPKSMDGVSFDADGRYIVNGAPVVQGKVRDLSLLPDMVRLEELALISQPIRDIKPIDGHVRLKRLYLSDSGIDSLTDLRNLPSLETLGIEHSGVSDLSPLEALPGLRTVFVSRDMLPLKWSDDASFDVILK